ncbi:MAG: hypothetical protein E3J83_02305 [Candidatus Atribacteria bacterium]|nr:MAG: hypothetical protein E3J83_02305 [Candidatus Atribacteria bacterium]
MQSWLLIGIVKNWEKALSQPVPIWGLKTRNQSDFNYIKIGDLLWFYSTSPVSGVIGIGAVKDKYIDNTNLVWDEEIKNQKVIWPLRFRIQVLKVLPTFKWKNNNIKINDFGLFWQTALHLLNEKHVSELLKRSETSLGNINLENIYAGASVATVEKVSEGATKFEEATDKKFELSHSNLKNQIAEIGKLQFYYSEVEYPIPLPNEKKNLDVIWKRELEGVPTYAFEIELSGMLERAVDRLVIAFKKWNSRPRIVIPKDYSNKLRNIADLTDRDFYTQLKIYEPEQIADLYNLKTNLKRLEQSMEIY